MSGVVAAIAAAATIRPITVTNWGTTNGAAPTQSSPARTLTVPGGNPGNLRLDVTGTYTTVQYSKNGAAYTTFTNGTPISVADTNTLAFRINGAAFDSCSVSVVDTSAAGQPTIGTWLSLLS